MTDTAGTNPDKGARLGRYIPHVGVAPMHFTPPTRAEIREMVERSTYQPEFVISPRAYNEACDILGLPRGTELTVAQVYEAAESQIKEWYAAAQPEPDPETMEECQDVTGSPHQSSADPSGSPEIEL